VSRISFQNGYVAKQDNINSLVFAAPIVPDAVRLTYAWNNVNFQMLPIETNLAVCQSVYGKKLLLQAERGGKFIYGLTSQAIHRFLTESVKPVWVKSQKLDAPIREISVTDTNYQNLVITTEGKQHLNFQVAQVNWDNNLPVIKFDGKTIEDKTDFGPMIRTGLAGAVTYDQRFNIIPVKTLPVELAQAIVPMVQNSTNFAN